MLCYNIYFYDRTGCIFYHEWLRPKPVKQGAGTLEDDQKQMFGLCWTLSNFCAALDPKGYEFLSSCFEGLADRWGALTFSPHTCTGPTSPSLEHHDGSARAASSAASRQTIISCTSWRRHP
eukprot:scaffold143594_cov19-Tisochrysis_lutea.AAC.1